LKEIWKTHPIPEVLKIKYSRLVSNNPELKEKEIKYIDDFKDVNLKNKCVKHFKADKIYFLQIVRRKNAKDSDNEYGFIDILKHEITLPKDLINLFLFCVLDLKSKLLKINPTFRTLNL
jgi:hypothetical protein